MKKIVCLLASFIFVTGASAKTAEQWAEELGYKDNVSYDGIRVMETKDGQMQFNIHHAPGKESMEMDIGGMQSRVIIRRDLGKSYSIMPSMGTYREMPLDDATKQANQAMNLQSVEEVGREDVNGFSATKYKTKFKDDSGKGAGFMWITDEGIPIKMDMIYASRKMKGQRFKLELKDLVLRKQDPALFELPAGLQPMNMSAIMQMAKQQQNAAGTATANQTPPTPTTGNAESTDPTIVEEVGDTAADEAKRGVLSETRQAVRKGLRGIFQR
jgi:hypothetical protein